MLPIIHLLTSETEWRPEEVRACLRAAGPTSVSTGLSSPQTESPSLSFNHKF
jgi:hypothetical protein